MRSDRTRRATLLAITGLLAFTRAHGGDDAAGLLARGACTAATSAAAAARNFLIDPPLVVSRRSLTPPIAKKVCRELAGERTFW